MNEAVMECYFLSRPFDEGQPIRGYRKRMHNIWKERQSLKVTEQRLCDQARMIRMNGLLRELEINVIKKSMMNANAEKNNQNSGNEDDDDDQGEATKNECENLVNVLQNNVSLSFENVEQMSEEGKIMIKNIIEIAEHNLHDEVNGFKKVDRNLLNDWTMKVNAVLKEIKPDNIIGTDILIKKCVIFVGRKVDLKPNQEEMQ